MKNSFKHFKSDKIAFRGFVVGLLLAVLTIVYILFNYKNLPPFIPIFNQLPWGNNRLTQAPGIFIPVVIFSFIFLANFIFSLAVYSKNPLIARILSATTLLVSIMNFLFIIRTVLVVI